MFPVVVVRCPTHFLADRYLARLRRGHRIAANAPSFHPHLIVENNTVGYRPPAPQTIAPLAGKIIILYVVLDIENNATITMECHVS